jgi:nucleotide-binding universal stress UspA family protein
MAYSLARRLGARALIAHVVTLPSPAQEFAYARAGEAGDARIAHPEVAERVVEEARALAAEMGVRAEAAIRTAASAPEAILALARERAADLLVLAANLRQLTGRPFLGHGVEYLLRESASTVVVVTVPPGWGGPARAR